MIQKSKNLIRYYIIFALLISVVQTVYPTYKPTETPVNTLEKTHTKPTLDTWISRAKENIHHTQLANGLNVIYYHLPKTYDVSVGLSYTVGSQDETSDQHGFAHMVEHMIFKGTSKMSETDLRMITEKFGVNRFNANTWLDQTNYYFISDNKNWHVFVDILADCMENVRFDEHHFASEVKAVINELKMRNANSFTKIHDLFYDECYPLNHPYGHAVGGNKEILIGASAQDLKEFYRSHYGPEHATLIIVGNLEKNQVFDQARKSFSHIKSQEKDRNNQTQNQNKNKNKKKKIAYNPDFFKLDFKKKNIDCYTHTPNPSVAYMWHIPGLQKYQNNTASCIAYILQERLRSLKDDYDLVLSINSHAYHNILAGMFIISLEPKFGLNQEDHQKQHLLAQALQHIQATINDLMLNGPTDQELKIFTSSCRNSFLTAFDNCSDIAQVLQSSYYINHNQYEPFDDLNRAEKLTQQDISLYCKQYLRPIFMNTITCNPIPENEKDAWLEIQHGIDQYEQKILEEKIRESVLETTSLAHNLPEAEPLSFTFEQPDESFTLSNGLTVYTKQRDNTPFVYATCLFKNEELFDLFCQINHETSIYHFTMQQLPEATSAWTEIGLPKQSKQDIRDFFDTLGASFDFHSQGGSYNCLSTDLITVAQHFVQILTRPVFPEKAFLLAQDNAIKRMQFNQENPQYLAHRKLSHYLYQAYPWIITDQEIIKELELCGISDLISFHERYITPTNMFLIVVGNIDHATIKQELEQSFGLWKSSEHAERAQITISKLSIDIPDIMSPSPEDITAFLPQEQVVLTCGRITTYHDTNDRMGLRLLEDYIQRRLFEIREKTGIFYGCHSNLSAAEHTTKGLATINCLVSVDSVAQAEQEIKSVLQNICDTGIPEADFKTAQQNYLSVLAKGFSTNASLAQSYGEIITNNKDWDYFNKKLENCDRLTVQEINTLAKKYLNPAEWTFVKIGRLS